MEGFEPNNEQSRREALAARSLDDLVEEYNVRIYGPNTDENLDWVEDLRIAIEAKRGDVLTRLAVAERQIGEHRAYLIIIGSLAVGQALVSAYGRDAVVAWIPVLIVGYVVWISVAALRKYFQRAKLKRKLFQSLD